MSAGIFSALAIIDDTIGPSPSPPTPATPPPDASMLGSVITRLACELLLVGPFCDNTVLTRMCLVKTCMFKPAFSVTTPKVAPVGLKVAMLAAMVGTVPMSARSTVQPAFTGCPL